MRCFFSLLMVLVWSLFSIFPIGARVATNLWFLHPHPSDVSTDITTLLNCSDIVTLSDVTLSDIDNLLKVHLEHQLVNLGCHLTVS